MTDTPDITSRQNAGDISPRIYIGTSGYSYRHWWDGVFYPRDVPQKKWLEFYTRRFDTVEINVSFYRLPKKATFEGWYRRSPEGFGFAIKGNRFITHIKKLRGCHEALKRFFEHILGLRDKLSIILWQLPPRLTVDAQILDEFCNLLSRLGEGIRNTFEFRDESWFSAEIYTLLRKYNYSLCIAHSPKFPLIEEITADFVYLRLHGGRVFYNTNYTHEELSDFASKINKWRSECKDVYAYFNNDAYGYATKNAAKLKEILGY
ncbi:MAG: DUF72 domain-containing protein [Pseudomonadota bacterium]